MIFRAFFIASVAFVLVLSVSLCHASEEKSKQSALASTPGIQLPRGAYVEDGHIFLEKHDAPAPLGFKGSETGETQAEEPDNGALSEGETPSPTEGGE